MTEVPNSFLAPGTPVDLDNCAREPIHLPGGIQPHGALLVARLPGGQVVQTSGNVGELISGGERVVLTATLDDLFGADQAARLVTAALEVGGPAVRVDRVRLAASGAAVDAHSFAAGPDLVGIDLEPADEAPVDAGHILNRVSGWGARLGAQSTADEIAAVAVDALRELAGFDRTWAYRFEPDGHGVVIAESRRDGLESFLGLHFPESDIPRQARELYLRSGARVIHDAASDDAPLVPLENPVTGARTDLSGSGLRAVSPIHIRYLLNMGVRTSMSVPLVVDGQLWGLLSAHQYDAPRRVPFRVRGECELLGVMASMQLAAASELAQTKQRAALAQAVARVSDSASAAEAFVDGLVADPAALLGVCSAAGAIVAIGAEHRVVGTVPEPGDRQRILDWVGQQDGEPVATDALPHAGADFAGLSAFASGVLAVPLSRSQGNWIVWLRPESIHEVTWANRDKGLVRRDPAGGLELGQRESFERWAEEVRGRSAPWLAAEIDAVRALRSSLGSQLIARTERLARLNDELTRSNDELDAFAYAAAHDLKEPVRGVEQLADFLLEDYGEVLGDEGRAQLQTILRLTDRMDGLLSSLLTYAELGEAQWSRSTLHLPALVDDVRELLAARLTDHAATIDVEDFTVEADETGLRQLLFNLIWNAVKYTDGPARVQIGRRPLSEAERGVTRARRSLIGDDEPMALYVKDEGIGISAEHHEAIFDLFRRLHGKNDFGGGNGAGLALSRRIVDRHGGVIWVESVPGEGSTFWFTLEAA